MTVEPRPAEQPEDEDPPSHEELRAKVREANRQSRSGPDSPAVNRAQ